MANKDTLKIKTHLMPKKVVIFSLLFLSVFILLIVIQDYIQASFQNSSFYFSESFLFSSFWWIFVPFYYAQFIISNRKKTSNFYFRLFLIIVPVLLHLLVFPLLIWVVSYLFYDHTFAVAHTLKYTLSEHLYKLIIGYSAPLLIYQYFKSKRIIKNERPKEEFIQSILVNEGSRILNIAIHDILYFEANTPYVNIHVVNKTYTQAKTLKTIAQDINDDEFIRIHKSTIVNLSKVQSYSSRLNGDYDLVLVDDTKLRISRNYASAFKTKFKQSHRVSTK